MKKRVEKTVFEEQVVCDRCGKPILVPQFQKCSGCGDDLCPDCSMYSSLVEDGDGDGLYCGRCWNVGEKFRKKYRTAASTLDDFYGEMRDAWHEVCGIAANDALAAAAKEKR